MKQFKYVKQSLTEALMRGYPRDAATRVWRRILDPAVQGKSEKPRKPAPRNRAALVLRQKKTRLALPIRIRVIPTGIAYFEEMAEFTEDHWRLLEEMSQNTVEVEKEITEEMIQDAIEEVITDGPQDE